MLACTVGARTTRDIDLLSTEPSLVEALGELIRLDGTYLGDFLTFEFAGSHLIKTEDERRDELSIRLVSLIGAKRLQPVSVDLVYPVKAVLADKLCGIVETQGRRTFSRVGGFMYVTLTPM